MFHVRLSYVIKGLTYLLLVKSLPSSTAFTSVHATLSGSSSPCPTKQEVQRSATDRVKVTSNCQYNVKHEVSIGRSVSVAKLVNATVYAAVTGGRTTLASTPVLVATGLYN